MAARVCPVLTTVAPACRVLFRQKFRFRKSDIKRLADCLGLPDTMKGARGCKADAVTALCVLLSKYRSVQTLLMPVPVPLVVLTGDLTHCSVPPFHAPRPAASQTEPPWSWWSCGRCLPAGAPSPPTSTKEWRTTCSSSGAISSTTSTGIVSSLTYPDLPRV